METAVKNIDRFEIIRILGRGAQSVAYLAHDPNLRRQVVIKTLHFSAQANRQDETQSLIRESRTVGQLHHPNIVPIFEAGEYDGDPYLVFEYIEGQTLADLLQKNKALPASEAAGILVPVLDALAHAHRNGIIHHDLKPSNILISDDGQPRVMDFGIAGRVDSINETSIRLGTPAYMAPEYINSGTIDERGDIFAAGLILYETTFGHKAVSGSDIHEVMQLIASRPIALPANSDTPIDEKLARIILKALAFNPQERYASAEEMSEALHAYLLADEEEPFPSRESKQDTLDFLLRRMRHKSDFPALSESVSAINRITSSEMESASKLANSILRDVALTNKILKLVNAAFYKSYGGGSISTISRAVIILGFDAVRNIAITLILFEHLQNKSHAAQLKDEFIRALFSAILAKRISIGRGMKDPEEAFICAMFHNLGRLLAMFYFPEEANAVTKIMAQKECSEDAASHQILGISYQDLGIGIARIWGFPEQIVHSMHKLPSNSVPRPRSPMDHLRIISGFSSELCTAIANTPKENRLKEIRKLSGRFGDHMPVVERQLPQTLDSSLEEITEYAGTVRLSLTQTPFGKQLAVWAGHPEIEPEEKVQDTTALDLDTVVLSTVQEFKSKPSASQDEEGSMEPANPQARLTAGIQDISNSLVMDSCSLNDILRMILETMYRSMGFQRVMLCIKDGKQNVMQGRFGFGLEITQTAKHFRIPLTYTPDVFHAAMSKGVDILISDINDPKIRPHIPDWYRKNIAARTFALFPLNIKNMPVALIYVDKEQAGDIRITDAELNLLRTLRNQAIMAIKQSL